MTTLTHKLRHNRGASITLALLFLLMCSLVAGSVLAAASAAATRAAARGDEQQAYLAVSSAAEFVFDDLAKAADLVATATDDTLEDWEITSDPPAPTDVCVLWGLLSDGVETIVESPASDPSYEETLTFTLDGTEFAEVGVVTLIFTMDSEYNITYTFTTDDLATPADESIYTMSFVSYADIIDPPPDEITDTFTLAWASEEIQKGKAATT
jgi:hypothetical protein